MSGATRGASATFHATALADLPALLAFVDAACERAGADAVFAVRLAVEEVFTNILEHGYCGEGPVDVAIEVDDRHIRVVLVDQAPPFDPDDAPAPDLGSDAQAREPGGLGWHLVHQVMDDVTHAAHGARGNTSTLTKRLPVRAP